VVVDEFSVDAPKTKQLLEKLDGMGIKDALIVTEGFDENLMLASRNLYHVDARALNELDPVSLIGYERVVITAAALKGLEEKLA
jgi:large subunit ribosomal protein L4